MGDRALAINWLGSDLSPVTLGKWLNLSFELNFLIYKRWKMIQCLS